MEASMERTSLALSAKTDDQVKVKKMLREMINDAEIISVNMDRETVEVNSLTGLSSTRMAGTETLTVKLRRSEKAPKFNAKEVRRDRHAIKEVLKKK